MRITHLRQADLNLLVIFVVLFEERNVSRHVLISIQQGSHTIPDKPLAAMGYRRRTVMTVPYFTAAMHCVAGTDLIATIPRRFAMAEAHNPTVRVLGAPPEIAPFGYVMTWHPRVNTDAAHAWLRDTLRQIGASLPS